MMGIVGKKGRFFDNGVLYLTILNIAIGIGIVVFIVLGLYQSFGLRF
jgi:hypothetical protein